MYPSGPIVGTELDAHGSAVGRGDEADIGPAAGGYL
jgi:hypothetical protein